MLHSPVPLPFPVEPTSGLGPYRAGGGGPHLNTTPKRPQPRVPPEQPGLTVTKQSKGAGREPPGERRARAATYPEGWALAGASARRIVGPAVGDAAPPGSGERRPPRGAGAVPRPPRVGPSAAASRAPSGEARGRWLPLPGSQSAGLAGRGRPWWSRAFCQKPFGGGGLQPVAPWGARKPGRAPGAGPGGGRCRGRELRGLVAVARAGSLRGKLTGKSPSWHRATRRSGPAGDKAQGTTGSSSIPEGATQLTLSSKGWAPPPHP